MLPLVGTLWSGAPAGIPPCALTCLKSDHHRARRISSPARAGHLLVRSWSTDPSPSLLEHPPPINSCLAVPHHSTNVSSLFAPPPSPRLLRACHHRPPPPVQLGLGPRAASCLWRPVAVTALTGAHVSQVAAGLAHSLCVTAQSQVYAWGANASGQCGLGDRVGRNTPTPVKALWALPVVQVRACVCCCTMCTAHGVPPCLAPSCAHHGRGGRGRRKPDDAARWMQWLQAAGRQPPWSYGMRGTLAQQHKTAVAQAGLRAQTRQGRTSPSQGPGKGKRTHHGVCAA